MKGNLFGNVAFSVVESGTTIAPHHGPSNIRIRCHLGEIEIEKKNDLKIINVFLNFFHFTRMIKISNI